MAENPQGCLPDVPLQWIPATGEQTVTERYFARNRRSWRRRVVINTPTGTLRRWVYNTAPSANEFATQFDRRAMRDFLRAKFGGFGAFYFFAPAPEIQTNFALGTITADTRFVLPFKGSTITDIRVGSPGVSTAFTQRVLTQRPSTYATLRFRSTLSQYVNCGGNASLKFAGDRTYTAWVYHITNGSEQVVLSNFSLPGTGSGAALRLSNTGALTFYVGTTVSFSSATCTTTFPAEAWTHVAVVLSGSNVTFFINGVQKNTAALGGTFVTATTNFMIGEDVAGALYWSGMLNDVRAFNVALSAAEIANIYAGSPLLVATMAAQKGYWTLTDGSGTTAVDSSGQTTNNGTLTGSPSWVYGEDEITFGSAQTGALTGSLTGRERMVCVYDGDFIPETFIQSANVLGVRSMAIQEVY